ncbi:MAG: hypothetical protein HKN13_08900, partial [Rhodothermales bacterium]|nr:hypothetical protein [Rhodothermales bacterium]
MKHFILSTTAVLIVGSFWVRAAFGQSAVLDNRVAAVVSVAPADSLVDIIVYLKGRHVFSGAERTSWSNMPKAERQAAIAHEIVGYARDRQAPLMALLRAAERLGEVNNVRSLAVANAIACGATPRMIDVIAETSDVRRVRLDQRVDPSMAGLGLRMETATALPLVADTSWGVIEVTAPEAWEVGANGNGTMVGVVDGGFWVGHADLEDHLWD